MGKSSIASVELYNFHIKGEKGIYEASFKIDDGKLLTSCSCKYKNGEKICWHRYYVLTGRKNRIPDAGEQELQQMLMQQLAGFDEGRYYLDRAKEIFGEKETCRRCNNSNVMVLKNSFWGSVIRLFLPKGRKFFCRSCRWSW